MKIAHIIRNIEYTGGTEKFLVSLLNLWKRKWPSDKVFLVCLEGVGPIAEKIKKRGVGVIDLPIRWWNPFGILKLKQRLVSVQPDIAHTHLFQADFPGTIASRLAQIPSVSTKYCQFSKALEKNAIWEKILIKPISDNVLEPLISLATDEALAVSREVAKYLRRKGYNKKRIKIVPCCHLSVESTFFKKNIKRFKIGSKLTIGTVSRLVPEKGIDNLVRIFSGFSHQYPNSKLHIAGQGYLQADLEKLVRKLKLQEKVIFYGHVEKVSEFLSSLDLFVFTSHTEGFPLAIQEAMASGLPIISTNVGGIRELVEHGKSGLLYKNGSNQEAVKLLINLVNHPIRAQKLGKMARQTMLEEYNVNKVANTIRKIYLNLV